MDIVKVKSPSIDVEASIWGDSLNIRFGIDDGGANGLVILKITDGASDESLTNEWGESANIRVGNDGSVDESLTNEIWPASISERV